MHRYKCLSCDTRIKSNKLYKDHINPKCDMVTGHVAGLDLVKIFWGI